MGMRSTTTEGGNGSTATVCFWDTITLVMEFEKIVWRNGAVGTDDEGMRRVQ